MVTSTTFISKIVVGNFDPGGTQTAYPWVRSNGKLTALTTGPPWIEGDGGGWGGWVGGGGALRAHSIELRALRAHPSPPPHPPPSLPTSPPPHPPKHSKHLSFENSELWAHPPHSHRDMFSEACEYFKGVAKILQESQSSSSSSSSSRSTHTLVLGFWYCGSNVWDFSTHLRLVVSTPETTDIRHSKMHIIARWGQTNCSLSQERSLYVTSITAVHIFAKVHSMDRSVDRDSLNMVRIVSSFESGARPPVQLDVKMSDIITCSSRAFFTRADEDVWHLHFLQ